MAMSRSVSSSFALVLNTKPLVGALAAALISCPSAYAASFGHSRIVSGLGQPLGIDIPVSQLSADDLRSLAVTPAPLSAWQQAGLTPPVALSDMRLQVVDGYTAGIKVIQLRSSTPFDQPIADVLLDVRTAAGQQRYQVSLLAHGGAVSAAAQRSSSLRDPSGAAASTQAGYTIKVRRGDTMFAIARRNAVPDASIYQLMIALQRANPQAFIHGNINLVKAGASLKMPSMADITAISDREARRIFMRQAHEFALYRQRAAAGAGVVGAGGDAAAGQVSPGGAEPQMEAADQSRDQLRLSSAAANGRTGAAPGGAAAAGAAAAGGAGSGLSTDARSDDQVATRKGIAESEQRVSQLEENVKHLSEALRAQGGAASGLVVDGAKGLSQSLADAVGGSPDGQAGSAAPGGAAAGGGTAGRPGQAAGGARQGSAGAPGGTATHGAGAQAGNGGAGGGAQAADAAGGKPAGAATAGSTAAAGNGSGASAAGSSATGSTAPGGAAAQPSGRERSGNGAGAAAGGNATSAGGPGGSSGAASGGASATASGGSTAAGSAAASPNGAGSSAAGPTASGGKDADSGAGAAAGGGAANAAAGSAGADGAPSGSSAGSASGATGDGSTGAANGQARSGSGNGGSAAQAGGAGIAAPGLPGRAGDGGSAKGPGAAAGADKPAQGAAAGGKADAASSADSNSTKAEQSVSWLQEHMLGVITGVLAFIVLIIAWLLRRANSANRDGDGHGVITDAMVQEKLEQINLDLDDGAEPRARRH